MNFKKVLSVFLCLVMTLSCVFGLTAFAEINDEPDPEPDEPFICEHLNTTVHELLVQEADCYHFQEILYETVCDDCGDTIHATTLVSPYYKHGPTVQVSEEVPETCISGGHFSHMEVCTLCGQSIRYGSGAYAPIQHEVLEETGRPACYETRYDEIPATCTESGSRTPYVWCTECNIEVSRGESEEIPASGHEWGEWTESDGKLVRICINCDASEEKPVENTAPSNDNSISGKVSNILESVIRFVRFIVDLFAKLFSR